MIINVFSSHTAKNIESFYMSDVYYRNDEYIELQIVKRFPWIDQSFPGWDYEIDGEVVSPILTI